MSYGLCKIGSERLCSRIKRIDWLVAWLIEAILLRASLTTFTFHQRTHALAISCNETSLTFQAVSCGLETQSRFAYWPTAVNWLRVSPLLVITYAKEGIVLRSVCLFVCFLATSQLHTKTTDLIFKEGSSRKSSLNFGRHPDLDPDLWIFWRNFHHHGIGDIQNISLISPKKLSTIFFNFFEGLNVSLATNQSILVLIRIAIENQEYLADFFYNAR